MKSIVIQAGHINCQNNSIVALRKNTGAPEEQRHNKEIADRLTYLMTQNGFSVIQTDACANDNPIITKNNYDLFLSLHCDSDTPGDNGGCFADFPEPSTDGATAISQGIAQVINEVYPKETQIVYKNASNANTRYYYMWKYLTAKTPCVLLEMGQSVDPHDSVLLNNVELIANAIQKSILTYFKMLPEPTPTDPHLAEIVKLNERIVSLESSHKDLSDRLAQLEGLIKTKDEQIQFANDRIGVLMAENEKLSADVEYYRPYKSRYESALESQVNKYTSKQLFSFAWKKFWEERKLKIKK